MSDHVTVDRLWTVGHGSVLFLVDSQELYLGVVRRITCVCYFKEKKHIRSNICDIVFRGKVSLWQTVFKEVKFYIRLHIEGDFCRLSETAFFGRWYVGRGVLFAAGWSSVCSCLNFRLELVGGGRLIFICERGYGISAVWA